MTDERRRPLRLPFSLTCATLVLALGAAACGGDDDAPPADASPPDSAMADAGTGADSGPDTGLPVA